MQLQSTESKKEKRFVVLGRYSAPGTITNSCVTDEAQSETGPRNAHTALTATTGTEIFPTAAHAAATALRWPLQDHATADTGSQLGNFPSQQHHRRLEQRRPPDKWHLLLQHMHSWCLRAKRNACRAAQHLPCFRELLRWMRSRGAGRNCPAKPAGSTPAKRRPPNAVSAHICMRNSKTGTPPPQFDR